MSASSGPGISLMQEGFSYLAGAELPCVIADIMRGGPGLGNIAPEQGDYNQIVKGGGHGNYRTLVLAPDSVQEMADLTTLAFDLADRYRNPVVVLADGVHRADDGAGGVCGAAAQCRPPPEWAVTGTRETRPQPDQLHLPGAGPDGAARAQAGSQVPGSGAAGSAGGELADRRRGVRAGGLRHRGAHPEGGGGSRRGARGMRAGLLRPITLYPFPVEAVRQLAANAKAFAVVEMSTGQMLDDVRLALEGRRPVEFYSRVGGNAPSAEEVLAFVEHKFAARRCRGGTGPCLTTR